MNDEKKRIEMRNDKKYDDDELNMGLIVLIGTYFVRAILLITGVYLLSRLLEHWR